MNIFRALSFIKNSAKTMVMRHVKTVWNTFEKPIKDQSFIHSKNTGLSSGPKKLPKLWKSGSIGFPDFFGIEELFSFQKKPQSQFSYSFKTTQGVLMKNFPTEYQVGASVDSNGHAILLETNQFKVVIPRDNQLVPGILRLEPKVEKYNNWNNWEDNDWKELLQIQRLIEFTLIEAFDKRKPSLKPTEDNKLVNFFGKQRKTIGGVRVYFDIAPRYSKPISFLVNSDIITFEDTFYGKPFDFSNKKVIADDVYAEIVAILRNTLQSTDFMQFELDDDFGTKWDNCYSCMHPQNHPENVGLVQVGKQGSNIEFSLALDSRSQEEKGRTFCDSDLHIPALRYWEDDRMAIVGELFKHHRHTVDEIYPSPTGEREFELAILMNLAKSPEGTHTHGHFIPRTPGSIDYGSDFEMNAGKYVPLTNEIIERQGIVNHFSNALVTQLRTSEKLQIRWFPFEKSPLVASGMFAKGANSSSSKNSSYATHSTIDKKGL